MKTTLPIALALLTACSFPLHSETSMETSPITGNDLISILELNVQKTKISFDSPKSVIFRWESQETSKEIPVKGATKAVSLMTYVPTDGGPIKPLRFWITGAEGTYSSCFAFDSSKAKFWRSEIIDGVFTIRASETMDFSGPLAYRIQILSTEK